MKREISRREKRRALKIFKEQQERVARDARELRDNEVIFNEKEATAKRFKAMGFSDEVIAKGTGLSIEKIKNL